MAKDVINLIFVKIKTLQTSPHPIDSYYYNEIINKRITGLYVLTYSGNTISLTYKKATGKITYLYEGYRTESGDCDCRNL